LLVVLRFVQGMALGGDWAAAVLLSSEHGGPKRRGFNGSFAQIGPAAGTLLATGVLWISTSAISATDFVNWGWRVPFALSLGLVAAGVWIRRTIRETPDFERLSATRARVSAPVRDVFRFHRRSLLVAGGVRIGSDVLYGFMTTFSLTYVSQVLKLPKSVGLAGVLGGAAAQLFLIPAFGALSDRIGRRRVYVIGISAGIAAAFSAFQLFDTRESGLIAGAIVFGMTAHAAMYGVQAALVIEQFDVRVRFAGSALAYTFAGVVGGGFAPLVIASLFRRYGSTLPISLYIAAALIVSLVAVYCARDDDELLA
jgi:MFS family permease